MAGSHTVDVTVLVVGEERRGVGNCPTLLSVATQYCGASLCDIRALNPHLAHLSADAPLPQGVRLQLPFTLPDQRLIKTMTGNRFTLSEAEDRLRRCRALLDECLRIHEQRAGAPVAALPERRVFSQLELTRSAVDAEVARQLPGIEARFRELGGKCDAQLPRLVEADGIKRKVEEITQGFSPDAVRLNSFTTANSIALNAALGYSSGRIDSKLSPIQKVVLAEADKEPVAHRGPHTHRWEFAVCRPHSLFVTAELAFLSSQRLTTLIDAMRSLCVRSNSHGYPFATTEDSFLYLSGTFYIDDRHEGYKDLTENIRGFSLPHGTTRKASGATAQAADKVGGDGNVFKRCPVRSAASVSWGDVVLRQGELCALRHLGGCTHYFYLKGVCDLELVASPTDPPSQASYPMCIAKAEEPPLLCQLCQTYPATVALYGDVLSPTNPALYCPVCFHLLHADDAVDDSHAYVKVVADGPGNYFKSI